MARFWSLSLLIAFLIIADQLSKGAIQSSLSFGETIPVIDGFFSIAHVQNMGAAFGFMADGPNWFRQIFFLAVPVLVCGWIFYLLIKTLKEAFYISLAYALILAGAIGNLIDRFSLGYVVDFFLFYWKEEANHFPAFNVADSCISIAAILLIIDFGVQFKSKRSGDRNVSDPLSKS